jgi:hypothetical protein
MRIKALAKVETNILNMANGAANVIAVAPANDRITITAVRKDGGNSYYFIEEYQGFVKKEYVKLLRDDEFYYSSKLLHNRSNRARKDIYAYNILSLFGVKTDSTSSTSSSTSSNNSIVPEYNPTTGTTMYNIKTSDGTVTTDQDGAAHLILSQQAAASNASAASQYSTVVGGTKYTSDAAGNITDKSSVKGLQTSRSLASIGVGMLNKTGLGRSGLGRTGISMLGSFASSGSWTQANNMNLGGVFGDSKLGSIFNGATISNLSDGSFFKTAADGWLGGQFFKNITSSITSLLSTLMQKLDYVVGFNLSGILLNWIQAMGVSDTSTLYGNLGKIYKPSFSYEYYSDIDERIRKYFQYKGANYQMITRTGDLMKWEQDAYYSTGMLDSSPDPDEVAIFQSMNNDLYSDFEKDLENVRTALNLNITREDWFSSFNRYRLITPDSLLGKTKGYVFFTRPDLNIITDNLSNEVGLFFFNMASQHAGIIGALETNTSSSHKFINLLGNRCTGLEMQDETLETKELADTLTGWKLNYGLNLIKSQTSNTVTTSFIEDEQLSIYLLFKIWCEYISAVSRGIMKPTDTYLHTKQLDYASSIYYILTAEDGESVLFWSKYTGCFPTNVPSSNFSDSIDSPVKLPKYSINWQYAFKKDYDPYSLAEFNNLSGSDFQYDHIYNGTTARSASTIAGAPFVDTNTGGRLFKLRFRPKSS